MDLVEQGLVPVDMVRSVTLSRSLAVCLHLFEDTSCMAGNDRNVPRLWVLIIERCVLLH